MLFNVLDEPVVRFDTVEGLRVEASLPHVYEALMADTVASFPALRPHQRHAWHAFVVQLGTLALHRSGAADPPVEAACWASAFRSLTDCFPNDEPWHLVVDDITSPAFLQPPAVSGGRLADYRHAVGTPDELDMLRTARNHDLKSAVATNAKTDDWLFALVTVQTMDGIEGRGNYGISRMNGGHGNRPAFSLAPAGGVGAHIRRDIVALVERRDVVVDAFPRDNPIHGLLWTVPWDGTRGEALLPGSLDPFYLEICRRIRLHTDLAGRLQAKRATSAAARIEAKQLKGRTGDPWTPVNVKEGKSLTVPPGGFTYKRITDYLTSGDYQRPVLLQPTQDEQDSGQEMRLVARAVVRGRGRTEGYHERSVPLRTRVVRAFGTKAGVESVGGICRKRIEEVGTVQRVLSYAIATFTARGLPDDVGSENRKLAHRWRDRLDNAVDADFFEAAQTEFEAPVGDRPTVHRLWLLDVVRDARGLLVDACETLPCPAVHRYRARTAAEALFERLLRGRSGLPSLFTEGR